MTTPKHAPFAAAAPGGRPALARPGRWVALLATLAIAACGGGSQIEADPAVAPFVGTWDATAFEVTSDADPSIQVDVLGIPAAFYISIEPSGQYTATLEHPLGAAVEIGQLTVIGGTVRLDPTIPADGITATSTFVFTTDDSLVLDGPTEYDFNGDFVADEAATAHIELQRR
jgi:hypothetical protein